MCNICMWEVMSPASWRGELFALQLTDICVKVEMLNQTSLVILG